MLFGAAAAGAQGGSGALTPGTAGAANGAAHHQNGQAASAAQTGQPNAPPPGLSAVDVKLVEGKAPIAGAASVTSCAFLVLDLMSQRTTYI